MVRSNSLKSLTTKSRPGVPARALVLLFSVFFLAFLPSAFGQDFTLQAAPFTPIAVDPGGASISTITVSPNTVSGPIDLTCQVTPQPVNFPNCQVSPASVTPPASATATITTNTSGGSSPPGLYTITVTGTDSATSTTHSAQQNLTVLAVTPQFTISVGTAIAPSSVHAGSGSTGVVNINPINGYTGSVTLSCSVVTPLVTIPPICSFSPQTIPVSGSVATSTITINTTGPTTKAALARPVGFYALWLPLPMLALVGVGAVARGKRPGKVLGVLAVLWLVAALLLMPACGSSSSTTTTTSSTTVTPNNTYTFTLSGVDATGVVSSNTGTTTSPTVSLTVN